MFQHVNVHPNNGITKKERPTFRYTLAIFALKNALYRLIFVPDRDNLNENETE